MAERKRVLIVGGVAGGASAATRARRLSEDAEIILFERGEHVSFANCGMPYHIGGAIAERSRLLVQTPEGLRKRYRLDVRVRTEAVRIDRKARRLIVRDLKTGEEAAQDYDALILSPGAAPVCPPIPGIDLPQVFTLRTLGDMDCIKRLVDEARAARAVVVGGGYIGLEMTEALRQRGVGVTLAELAGQVFAAADPEMVTPIHQQLELHGVDLRLGTSVTAIHTKGAGLEVRLSTGEKVACGLVIMAIGVRPEATLAREAGLELGQSGGIVVDEHMRTSDPNIYAVGDAIEVAHLVGGHRAFIPLAGPANRQGRIAADDIFGRPSVYKSSQGTAICKVFDLAIGMTGMNEKALTKAGRPYEKVYVHPTSHAGYYPGAAPVSLKLLFDPKTGRILGAQAVGTAGVDKRIDVLATAMRAHMTVHDLKDLELSYAPPYGSAKDPVNYAGFVASNVLAGDVALCHVQDVLSPRPDRVLLDVRTPAEVEAGTIPGARNIPVEELRTRLAEVPRDKEVLAFCQVGLRGYLACRILAQNGIRCRNLTGGYKTYQAATAAIARAAPPRPKTQAAAASPVAAPDPTDAPLPDPPGAAAPLAQQAARPQVARQVDARGLQCPGPIMRLRAELDGLRDGQALTIVASEPGFPADVAAWCHSTGHELVETGAEGGAYRATVAKRGRPACASRVETTAACKPKDKTIVVFSGDLDRAMAAFIIANGAAAMGSRVTMFFTFWGLNILRRPGAVRVRKGLTERLFGWMMPRGADRLALSQMNMGGIGLRMIKAVMRRKNVSTLPDLISSAMAAGVRLVACAMSMDLMGIRREELLDGVEEGGVATYLDRAEAGGVNLFV
jgi:NADPH-dependent 2,4-dienoyl-CoA reductase/sulfur reductase-like enzyme/peroxiredoxin family protein/TusA-related sulfurtransferase/rhodanese-related sulfurtransferase